MHSWLESFPRSSCSCTAREEQLPPSPERGLQTPACQVCCKIPSSTKPSGFGTSCDPLGPPTSPAEAKAAFLLSLTVTTALRRHGAKCRGHDAISMQTCSIKTCVSHLFCPHGSQSSSQIKHVKHHCPQLGNVCCREGTQRALEVLGRKFRICATPKQSAGQALGGCNTDI